eukprot:4757255-Prymnesium_polylepis.1
MNCAPPPGWSRGQSGCYPIGHTKSLDPARQRHVSAQAVAFMQKYAVWFGKTRSRKRQLSRHIEPFRSRGIELLCPVAPPSHIWSIAQLDQRDRPLLEIVQILVANRLRNNVPTCEVLLDKHAVQELPHLSEEVLARDLFGKRRSAARRWSSFRRGGRWARASVDGKAATRINSDQNDAYDWRTVNGAPHHRRHCSHYTSAAFPDSRGRVLVQRASIKGAELFKDVYVLRPDDELVREAVGMPGERNVDIEVEPPNTPLKNLKEIETSSCSSSGGWLPPVPLSVTARERSTASAS